MVCTLQICHCHESDFIGLLITCARKAVPDLAFTGIDIRTLPPANINRLTGDRAPVIIVSDGGVRTWLLSVDECRTWPVCTNLLFCADTRCLAKILTAAIGI
jgi:hypothetical protein